MSLELGTLSRAYGKPVSGESGGSASIWALARTKILESARESQRERINLGSNLGPKVSNRSLQFGQSAPTTGGVPTFEGADNRIRIIFSVSSQRLPVRHPSLRSFPLVSSLFHLPLLTRDIEHVGRQLRKLIRATGLFRRSGSMTGAADTKRRRLVD